MFATSLPIALDSGAGIPGLAVAMVLIALGIGGIKSTITPFIGMLPETELHGFRLVNDFRGPI